MLDLIPADNKVHGDLVGCALTSAGISAHCSYKDTVSVYVYALKDRE